jgi:ribosomal-protein-alanine N-acetyltransferase
MREIERIETDRLVLRRPRTDDAESIFARYASNPEVMRLLGWPRHRSPAATRRFLEFSDTEWTRWPAGPYLIESRENGTLLGGTAFGFETPYRAQMGYVLAKDAWGKGYATEALRALTDVAAQIGLRRIYALCHTEHPASVRVLEKCGFIREGILRRHSIFPNLDTCKLCDVLCYALIIE